MWFSWCLDLLCPHVVTVKIHGLTSAIFIDWLALWPRMWFNMENVHVAWDEYGFYSCWMEHMSGSIRFSSLSAVQIQHLLARLCHLLLPSVLSVFASHLCTLAHGVTPSVTMSWWRCHCVAFAFHNAFLCVVAAVDLRSGWLLELGSAAHLMLQIRKPQC